ncbi:hypothetical protein OpiT1DRAFT_03472 [Opitutaceae bacterium TAV1]|nr:hypothetical protein OpiT1DRAFT_03472 [Opitutaceae bacterium TAV1]
MSYLDTHRFDHLSEAEVVSRIGNLLALAIVRSSRLETDSQGLPPDIRLLRRAEATLPAPAAPDGNPQTGHPPVHPPPDETGATETRAA